MFDGAELHQQWVDSLEYYNPLTYEFREASPPPDPAIQSICDDTHSQIVGSESVAIADDAQTERSDGIFK